MSQVMQAAFFWLATHTEFDGLRETSIKPFAKDGFSLYALGTKGETYQQSVSYEEVCNLFLNPPLELEGAKEMFCKSFANSCNYHNTYGETRNFLKGKQ